MVRSSLLLGVLIAAFTFTGCHDDGVDRYQRVREKLLDQAAHHPPSGADLDAAAAELKEVSPRSKAYRDAQHLLAGLDGMRSVAAPPQRPLAVSSGNRPLSAGVKATQDACAELARQLGSAGNGERAGVQHALEECQRRLQVQREAEEEAAGAGSR